MRTIDQLEQEVRKNGVSLDGYRKMIEMVTTAIPLALDNG